MKYLIAFVFCIASFLSPSQVFEYFHLTTTSNSVYGSLYNTVHFIDSRTNSKNLGFVYSEKGLRKLLVMPEQNFQEQFENLFLNCCDSALGKGELIVQFRRFEFIDVRQMGPDYSYCELRIQLYEKKDSLIFPLALLDTIVSLDVINKEKLFQLSSDAITGFVTTNLLLTSKSKSTFSFFEVTAIDSVEKYALKLYSDPIYTDGLYKDFNSFKNQKPDLKLVNVVFKDGRAHRVIYKNKRGKPEALEPGTFYAFVFKGLPYIVSQYGYYALVKKNTELLFTGEFIPITEPSEGRIAVRAMKNISETINPGGTRLYDMMIDHTDGTLIQIKEHK